LFIYYRASPCFMPHLATVNRTATIYTSQNLTALPVSANVARKHCLGTFPSKRVAENNTGCRWKHYYCITKRVALSFHHQHTGSHFISFQSKRRSMDEKVIKRGSFDVLQLTLNKHSAFLPSFASRQSNERDLRESSPTQAFIPQRVR